MTKRTEQERFWAGVSAPPGDSCWTRHPDTSGYARFRLDDGQVVLAHRYVYELVIGPIPPGYDVDHLCHNADTSCPGGKTCPHRACCNPVHLQAVVHITNVDRGRKSRHRTVCDKGHPFTDSNTKIGRDGYRRCLTCRRAAQRCRRRTTEAGGQSGPHRVVLAVDRLNHQVGPCF